MSVSGHSGTVVDHGSGRLSQSVVLVDASGNALLMSTVLEDVHDDVNHMLQVRQVALAGDTDSVTTQATGTNRGGTITSGGTSQEVMAANSSRRMWRIQNTSDTDMHVGIGITPSLTVGYLLAANGGGLESNGLAVETAAINIHCATTGKTFAATEI